ncbi:MAG: nuclear transport factor 2 family protein [Acidimicrobiales bacterium]|nr:nuclear transport factor 2 family protein [Acidimicrobiales bacterium]
MIRTTIERWHEALRGESAFEDLLHEDCVFWSPVLFRPMEGRDLTALYLRAAYQVFPGDGADATDSTDGPSGFRYTKRVLDGNHAVLEFETTMDGVSVNGVDIITCDDDGLITEFKVMVRPRKAVEKVQAQMAAMLEQMPPATGV